MVGLILTAVLILCGLIAASPLIIAKRPDAQQVLDKIAPYQAWLGLVTLAMGLIGALNFVLNLKIMFSAFFLGLMTAVSVAVSIALGFLLAFPLLQQWIFSKNEQARAKGEMLRAKLQPYQVWLGVAAIAIVLVWLLASTMAQSGANAAAEKMAEAMAEAMKQR